MNVTLLILLGAGLLAFVLKVCHDQRAYERAWRDERQRFDDYIAERERYLRMRGQP